MSAGGFARSTFLFAVAAFIPRVGLFLLLPFYARFLAPSDLGAFSLMVSVAGLLAIVYRLGLDAALLRFHFLLPSELGVLYATTIRIALVATLGLSVLTAAVLWPTFASLFAGIEFVPLGALALALSAANAFQFVPYAWFRATDAAGRYLLMTLASFAAGTIATVLLVAGAGWVVVGALLGQMTMGVTTAAVAAFVVLHLRGRRFDADLSRRLLRFSVPLMPHSVSGWILNVSDRWLLALLLPLAPVAARAEIGVYWVGYQMGYAVALLAVSLQSAWLPLVYRQRSPVVGAPVVSGMLLTVVAGLMTVALALVAAAPELVSIVAGSEYERAVPVLAVVALASIAYGGYTVVVPVLLHEGRTGTMAIITALAGATNVIVNLVAIPTVGIMGAAIATLVANSLYFVVTLSVARREWPLPLHAARLGAILAIGAASVMALMVTGADTALALRLLLVASFALVAFMLGRPGLDAVRAASGHADGPETPPLEAD